MSAITKLADENTLSDIVRQDADRGVRLAAVKKIKTQSILAEFLNTERDIGVRTAILEQVTDQTLLGLIVQQHSDPEVRAAASSKLAVLLRAAITLGDSAIAISLLAIPGDHYLARDMDGWTPLHCAAFSGDLHVLQLLLSKGAPADCRDSRNNWTPLHYAAAHGHSRLIAPLIKGGADANAASGPDGNTPLHIAVAMGYPPGYIVSHKGVPNLNMRESDLQKVLQGHPDVASELLKHGADPKKPSKRGLLPLHMIAERGDVACATLLIERGVDLNARGPQESTALHWAASKGREEIANLLVTHGADVNAVDSLGWTPAFLASADGFDSIVKMLLAHGAKTTATINGKDVTLVTGGDANGKLLDAAEDGDFNKTKSAIEAGADVNCKSRDGWTPLLAASKDSSKIVEFLLANGADPNIPSDRGYTALMRAAGNGALEIVRLLVAAGADKKLVDCNGKTAYELAMETNHRTCAQMIR
ncbi:MAG: ankyrin repeat domain-containing protein [Candidatus Acidiferrum sp.]